MRQKNYRVISLLVVGGFMVATLGNGCGQDFTTQGGGSSNGGTSVGQGVAVDEDPLIPGQKTVSFVYSKQVLDQLTSCVGVARPSELTLQTYEAKKGAISVTGEAKTITPPMMMAIVTIAGEVCNDLIEQEIKTPRLFTGINLSGNAAPSTASLNEAISKLALSCWSRAETAEEKTTLSEMIYSSVGTEAKAGRNSALMLCTAMLSSVDALLN